LGCTESQIIKNVEYLNGKLCITELKAQTAAFFEQVFVKFV